MNLWLRIKTSDLKLKHKIYQVVIQGKLAITTKSYTFSSFESLFIFYIISPEIGISFSFQSRDLLYFILIYKFSLFSKTMNSVTSTLCRIFNWMSTSSSFLMVKINEEFTTGIRSFLISNKILLILVLFVFTPYFYSLSMQFIIS